MKSTFGTSGFKRSLAAIAVSAVLGMSGAAQAAGSTGTVVGGIYGVPATGYTVTIKNPEIGFSREVTVDANGSFRFPQLAIGQYELTVTKDGKLAGKQMVRVSVGGTSNAKFDLGNNTGVERIEVSGARVSAVDLTSADSGLTIGEMEFDRLPVGRNITAIAMLAPGTVKGDGVFGDLASFSGSSVAENVCYINGMNVTDPDKGLGCGSVPFEFYKEFQVKTGGYSAQYGRATGGVINAVTKSGTNEFEFGATAYYTPDYLGDGKQVRTVNGTVYKDTTLNEDTTIDASISAGGPIIKDKLFFFAMVNPKKRERIWTSSADARASSPTHLNDNSEKGTFWGLKLDWEINDTNRLSYLGFSDGRDSDRMRQGVSYDTQGNMTKGVAHPVKLEDGGDTHTLTYIGNFTDTFTASAMVGQFKTDASIYPANTTCSAIGDTRNVPVKATQYSCGPGIINDFNELTRKSMRVDFEWAVVDDHLIRFGYDSEKIEAEHTTSRAGGFNYTYSTLGAGAQLQGTSYINNTGAPMDVVRKRVFDGGGAFSTDNYALYLEDQWTINEHWFLTAGIRSDVAENKGKTGVTFVELDDQIAPRLGLTYDPTGNGDSKVFANYGQYFFPIPINTNFRTAAGIVDKSDFLAFTSIDTSNGTPVGTTLLGTSINSSGSIPDPILSAAPEYSAQSVKEYILGYQHELNEQYSATVRATYRTTDNMGDDYCDREVDPTGDGAVCTLFNPGKGHTFAKDEDHNGIADPGSVRFYTAEEIGVPEGKRDYSSVQLELVQRSEQLNWTAQYTWAHSYGNNEGGVNSDNGQTDTGVSSYLDFKSSSIGASGNLPNDRRHAFKFFGSYSLNDNWSVGWNSSLLDGRPLNAMGRSFPINSPIPQPGYGDTYYTKVGDNYVLNHRGSMGRQPWVFNLDMSVSYAFDINGITGRASMDIFNLLDTSQSLTMSDLAETESGTANVFYGLSSSFQTPRQMRLGVSLDF